MPRSTAGENLDPERSRLIEALLDATGVTERRDLYRSILATVASLAAEHTEPIDLKLAVAALAEMAEAFRVFRPFRDEHKVTFFGSARTLPDDPLYVQARRLAERMAGHGWMVVTGAGPGIMAAGMEGAGREKSIGVNIRLPLEQGANAFIAQDPKLVEMRYFFTRKLMLIKESDGYAVLPGGLRHPRRGLRAPHPAPDGQGPAGSPGPARRPRRHLLAGLAALRRRTGRRRAAWSPRRTVRSTGSPPTWTRHRRDPRLLPQLPLVSAGSATFSSSA